MDNIQDIAKDNSNMSDTTDTSDTSIENMSTVSKMTETEMTLAMNKNYSYPDAGDASFLHDIYKKAEFYNHRIPERPDINDYNDIKDYRDNICARDFSLHEHQAMVSNFINPDTPYRGLLLFHGLGTGKCVAKDTLILINGSYIKIEELWNSCLMFVMIDSENGEWKNTDSNIYVVSYNNNNNSFGRSKISRLYREKINAYMYEVILKNGNSIKLTFIHKLFVYHDNVYEWTNIYKIGDKVCIYGDKPYFEEIVNILINKYDDYVYDVEVENTHNYIANNILCHNTCAGVAIAEKFKQQVQKYNTKIHVLVSGPLIREVWKAHLLKCTKETYLKYQDKSVYISDAEKAKNEKNALFQAMQYYKFMSYRSFYKRVLGEKILDKKTVSGNKVKVSYRKTDEGDYERDISVDRLFNLNNSIILVDEAHNLTDNAYGEALMHIIKNSVNLRVVLLTGTPMKNLADDIIPLLNFIRPPNAPIERDMIFDSNKNHTMAIKEGGISYLKKMAKGYISHVRGADPLTFATRIDKGEKPDELIFTKVIRCSMLDFQQKLYDETIKEKDDALDRRTEAVANFVFPYLSNDKKLLEGIYGREGLNDVKNQLKTNFDALNKKIAELLQIENTGDLLYVSEDNKTITGKILHIKYLKHFSVKFYKALKKINRLVDGKKGARLAFVYSNLVKVGIEIFQQILIQNGYLEYQENNIYNIVNSTICYFCGKPYGVHKNNNDNDIHENINDLSESSTDYEGYTANNTRKIAHHDFAPATFMVVTGKSSDEAVDVISEDKKRIIDTIYNSVGNKSGKHIKFILGSKVMNEGLSLMNIAETHILDVYYNLGKIDQVIGRGIRQCSHYKLMSSENQFPFVNIYKYVVSVKNGLSSEEELYKKAEEKYLLIKKIERAMKEIAIDCPLNIYGNMFKEEINKWKDCGENKTCPTICDFQKCEYKCDEDKLNMEFYDPDRKIYKNISRNTLDYTTFSNTLARNQINYVKQKIKELYVRKYEYTLDAIINYIKKSYNEDKTDLFDEFFVFKALDELLPITENDFISYTDTILDKYNRQGYLIYVGSHYIFQPFDQNEDIPMHYRTAYNKPFKQKLSLGNYLKNTVDLKKYKNTILSISDTNSDNETNNNKQISYNFNDTMEYYDNRDEYKYVGIIDRESIRKKSSSIEDIADVFKIRDKRAKILDKKRGTGIPSLKGAVCFSSKNREVLENISKELKINIKPDETRQTICDKIKDAMLLLEKYGTDANHNKLTYVMVPSNHPTLRFPYNLEDYIDATVKKIKKEIAIKLNITVSSNKKKSGYPSYSISFDNNPQLDSYTKFLSSINANKNNNKWVITVE